MQTGETNMRPFGQPRRFTAQVAVAFVILAACGLSTAQPDPLADLKQLFGKDPATAFEKAWKLFQEPRKKGDLEGT